jgi:hypothetical protein
MIASLGPAVKSHSSEHARHYHANSVPKRASIPVLLEILGRAISRHGRPVKGQVLLPARHATLAMLPCVAVEERGPEVPDLLGYCLLQDRPEVGAFHRFPLWDTLSAR